MIRPLTSARTASSSEPSPAQTIRPVRVVPASTANAMPAGACQRHRVTRQASARIDEVYRYTRERWGEAQADKYVTGLFDAFESIEAGTAASRPVPAEFGVDGYLFRYRMH